jgi:glycosyltransferase involved in cell wall biosynthesis
MKIPPRSMISELRHSEADIVHAHGIQNIIPYFAQKGVNDSKFVITSHYSGTNFGTLNKVLFKFYKPFLTQCLHKANHVIAVSNFERHAMMDEFKIGHERISVIPNGVERFEAGDAKVGKKKEFRIMFAGRLDFASKNIDKLITAFSYLDRDDAKLVIVGNGPDKENIVKMINSYGIQEKVELIVNPPKARLGEEYHKADIFVMPSMYECFGMAAAEALSAGVATIVTNSTALSDFVNDQHAFGIEPPVTPEKISEAITKVSNGNMQFKKYDGPSWDMIAEKTEKLYADILGI